MPIKFSRKLSATTELSKAPTTRRTEDLSEQGDKPKQTLSAKRSFKDLKNLVRRKRSAVLEAEVGSLPGSSREQQIKEGKPSTSLSATTKFTADVSKQPLSQDSVTPRQATSSSAQDVSSRSAVEARLTSAFDDSSDDEEPSMLSRAKSITSFEYWRNKAS